SRSTRCEGLYVSPVSATSLELISLLRGKLHYNLQPNAQLILSAPDVADIAPGAVHVRAIARALKTYYRMDAVLPATRQMSWPVDNVLLPLRLSADRLGVFGWVEKGAEKIFVPLRVVRSGDPAPQGPVELIIRSTADIDSLVWRSLADGGLSPGAPTWQEVATRVTGGQSVTLSLPQGPRTILRVEVKAKPSGSDSWLSLPLRVLRDAP